MDDSARQIRTRIFWIVLRAFVSVLLFALIIIIIGTGYMLSNNSDISPFNRLPIISKLEGYYSGMGSWVGVEKILNSESYGNSLSLLDPQDRIVIYEGKVNTDKIGKLYDFNQHEIVFSLKLNNASIGSIVFNRSSIPSEVSAVANILFPVSLLAIFLALLASVLVALLTRRIVTPLAEVIAASRSVTAGKLNARVQVQGTQDLLVLTDSFNQMAASIERSNRERRDLLADIAHELRTPISAIRGRLEGILDGVYPADEKHISLALKANYLLERLVEDLRLLTLAELGQLQFEKKVTDLKDLVSHSIDVFSAEAQEKSIQLEFMPPTDDYITCLDPQRTEQVIANLIGNAVRYTQPDGKVLLTLEKSETQIHLSISDNGPGVPEEDLPFIFNRFWRKDKSRARLSGGSGLGLAIARQLCEAQNGNITAENPPEGGLKITVSFPVL